MSKILYIAPFRDFSGYAVASRGYLRALDEAGAGVTARAIRYDQADPGSSYQITQREKELLSKPLEDIEVIIQHTTPNECRISDSLKDKTNIAIVAWETTRIPQYWVDKLNKFDAVITFCTASVDAFKACGVTIPISKIPHTFDIPGYNLEGVEPIVAPTDPELLNKRFVFYNISQFATKKGIDLLLRAYYGAFHGRADEVILIMKSYVNMTNRENEQKKLEQYIHAVKAGMRLPVDGYPPIMLITKTLSDEKMRKLHATGDCYVCSSRGEGWCIPAFDALTYGNQLVTTLWGGMKEFAVEYRTGHSVGQPTRDNVYPVDYSMEPLVGQTHADPELYTAFDLVAEPSVSSMMEQMRETYNQRDKKLPAPDMMEFDHSKVGPKMLKLIEEIVASKTQEVSNV